MQIKTTLRFHLTPVRMAKIKNSGEADVGEDVEKEEHSSTAGGVANWYNHSRNHSGSSSENWAPHFQKILLYHSWAYTQKISPACNKDTCSTMFIAALFIIARSWKEPRYPSTEEWMQKMWYIYTVEYYSAIRNNEFMKFLGKWMELENIILSEVTQTQKMNHGMHSLISGY